MSTTPAFTTVGVADPIRRNPELDRAVMLATRYFEDLLVKHEVYEAERELIWMSGDPLETTDCIALQITETDKFGRRQVSRTTRTQRLLESTQREGFILDLLSDLLRQHSIDARRIRAREIQMLESEEMTHAVTG